MEGSQPAHGDTELVTQEQTRDARSASTPEAAATSIQASSQISQMESMLGHRHSRLIALLARSIVGCMDNGYTNSGAWLWQLPLRWGWFHFAADATDSIVTLQGRPDVLAELVTHLIVEHDMHRPLQLIVALLRRQRVEALCALCCKMANEGHVAQVATLLAEAARQGCHTELAALMLHMVREDRQETARDMAIIMLVNRREDVLGLVFMHMLRWSGVKEVAILGIAIAEAGGIMLACDIKRAMLPCQAACHAPVGLVCMEVIRMGRADLVARGLIRLHGEDHLEAVAEAMGSMHSAEAVQATVQVSLALASSNRPDVMTDVKLALLERGHLDLVKECITTCVNMGHAWVPAALSLELLRRGKVRVEVDFVRAIAQDGGLDVLAKWMGVMIRGGHAKEWAEIAGELHKQGLFWIVADIITQLVPAGRVAVEAHNAICEYLGPEYAADVHILMVEGGHLDDICQMTAALIINNQARLLIRVVTSIVDDRDRADIVARKQVRFLETGHDAIVAVIHNELINEGRFLEGAKLAAAIADVTDVVQFLEHLRAAGARVMPEIWHYATTACFRAGRVVHPDQAPSPGGRREEPEPDVLEDAELTTGDSQAALLYVQGHDADKFSQQALQPVQEGEQKEPQDANTELSHLQPSTPPTGSRCIQPQIIGSPIVVGVAPPGAECMQREHKGQPEHGSQPVLSAED